MIKERIVEIEKYELQCIFQGVSSPFRSLTSGGAKWRYSTRNRTDTG